MAGWKLISSFPDASKSVIIEAPHTSAMDFVLGWLGLCSMGIKARFIIKKEFFFFPVGPLIKMLGAIPVKRGSRDNDIVAKMVEMYNSEKSFYLVITPEGTRKKVKKWKSGFYRIAQLANVPIVITYLDYAKKEMCIVEKFIPTGDYEKDLTYIRSKYTNVTARYPENFSNI